MPNVELSTSREFDTITQEAEREHCIKLICPYCANGRKVMLIGNTYMHPCYDFLGVFTGYVTCRANTIRRKEGEQCH